MFDENIIITNIAVVIAGLSMDTKRIESYHGRIRFNELIFKYSGESKINYKGQIFTDSENCIRFLPQTDEDGCYTAIPIIPGEWVDIMFETLEPIKCDPFMIKPTNAREIAKLFSRIFAIWRSRPNGYKYKCISLLYEILYMMQESVPQKRNPKMRLINPGVEFMKNNFLVDVKMEEVAEKCGISYSYFKRLFNEIFFMSPKAYMIKLRNEYACDLIRSERYTFCQISEQVGYDNVYYFSRSFKNTIGVSPRDYRNMVRTATKKIQL